MDLIIKIINGVSINYSEVSAPQGYCFYDKDEENRNYMEKIFTPITDEEELRNKYILVEGDVDNLNEKLTNELNEEV